MVIEAGAGPGNQQGLISGTEFRTIVWPDAREASHGVRLLSTLKTSCRICLIPQAVNRCFCFCSCTAHFMAQ